MLEGEIKSLVIFDQLYKDGDVKKKKRQIIGSIFPEKFVFDGRHYRTGQLNEAVRLICVLVGGLPQNKNGQIEENLDCSILVPRTGFVSSYR